MLDKLKEILKNVVPGVNMDEVTAQTRLVEDLSFDSLSMMMMSLEIEEAFGFRFEEMIKFNTVGDVCKYLEERVG
jgi:acyl carrier protein